VWILEFKPNYDLSFEEMRKERWTPVEGFLKGIKPACFENINRLSSEELVEQLEKYPNIQTEKDIKIYFQTTDLKRAYAEQSKHLQPGSVEWVALIGHTLGYPPKAVSYYARQWENESEIVHATKHISLNYCGVHCAGNIDDLVENVHWLWDTYNHPISMWTGVKWMKENIGADFRIRYRNEKELKEVKETMEAILEQNKQIIMVNT
jgi:hypothetical protein